MWHYVRIDHLPDDAICYFCHRPLRSGKGFVIADDMGREAFTGPSCAKKHVEEPDVRVLNVAQIAMCAVVKETPSSAVPASLGSGSKKPSKATQALPALEESIAYVRLRHEMMSEFTGGSTQLIREAHESIEALGAMPEEVQGRILGLMRNARTDNTVFSLANIKRCIAFNYWLSLAKDNTEKSRQDFLLSLLDKLHARWSLTQGQISAVNKWGAYLPSDVEDFPILDERAFEGVTLPEFMKKNR